MRILIIQHHPKDEVGILAAAPLPLEIHRADLDPVMPALGDAKALILGGGPQTAYSDEDFASRVAELHLIQEALDADIPVLGVCLGAQLLAIAAGGEGFRMGELERGWLPVTLTEQGTQDSIFRGCARQFAPRQNHNDSYTLPPGAVRLASSEHCVEQAFRLGEKRNAWGLQFHFEMDRNNTRVFSEPTNTEIERAEADAAMLALLPTAQSIVLNFYESATS